MDEFKRRIRKEFSKDILVDICYSLVKENACDLIILFREYCRLLKEDKTNVDGYKRLDILRKKICEKWNKLGLAKPFCALLYPNEITFVLLERALMWNEIIPSSIKATYYQKSDQKIDPLVMKLALEGERFIQENDLMKKEQN